MGLCASQARVLMLTARKSDLEFRRMQISNAKQMLAMQTEMVAKKQSEALGNMKTQVKTTDNGYQDLTYTSLNSVMENGRKKYLITYNKTQTSGDIDAYVINSDDKLEADFLDENNNFWDVQKSDGGDEPDNFIDRDSSFAKKVMNASADEFALMLARGEIIIQAWNPDANNGNGAYVPCNPGSTAGFDETYDTSDDALAEAEYTREMARIKAKEQALDLESQQIETQHSAVSTEIESVQNLVKKNSETSFRYFS